MTGWQCVHFVVHGCSLHETVPLRSSHTYIRKCKDALSVEQIDHPEPLPVSASKSQLSAVRSGTGGDHIPSSAGGGLPLPCRHGPPPPVPANLFSILAVFAFRVHSLVQVHETRLLHGFNARGTLDGGLRGPESLDASIRPVEHRTKLEGSSIPDI